MKGHGTKQSSGSKPQITSGSKATLKRYDMGFAGLIHVSKHAKQKQKPNQRKPKCPPASSSK